LITLIRPIVGSVLLLAACLKAKELLVGVAPHPIWFTAAVIQIELLCGVALLLRVLLRYARWGTLILFASFSAYALRQLVSGETSCSCFGDIQVLPLCTFVFDVFVLLALFLWTPSLTIPHCIMMLPLTGSIRRTHSWFGVSLLAKEARIAFGLTLITRTVLSNLLSDGT
jgi:hypothetical protein